MQGLNENKIKEKKSGGVKNIFTDYLDAVHTRKNLFLLWAFLLPMGILLLLYVSLKVYPFGDGSVLVLDLNGQYVYFFEELRSKILSGGSLLYSWSRSLGGEFLGIFAYYLASPFSILVCLFPKAHITEALLLILLLKAGSCGFTMSLYLKNSYPARKSSMVAFSTMYALCSFAVVQAHNTMWIDELIFLPLVVLGIERLIKKKDFVLYTVSLAFCAMSNFYIGYMVCIFTFFYFFSYYFAGSGSGKNNPLGEKHHFLRSLLRMIVFSVIALEIAMVVLYPAYISLTFGKTGFSDPSYELKQKFDFLDFIAKLFPASYDTVRPEGLPFVYCGTLTLIMLPMFFLSKKIGAREKIAGGALISLFIFSFMGSTFDLVWHGFQVPNWLNYRYSFMLVFVMIVFAYRAISEIRSIDYRHIVGICGVLALLLIIIQKQDYEWYSDIYGIWISMAFIGINLIVLYIYRKGWLKYGAAILLVGTVCFEMMISGFTDEYHLDKDVVYSSRTSYQSYLNKLSPIVNYLKEYDSENFGSEFYRMEKTSHRKTNDAMALGMYGISNSTSTLNASVIDLLQKLGFSSKSHWSKYLGGTPVSDSLLGIKYIINTDYYDTDIYELIKPDSTNKLYGYYNPYALSLCYGVNSGVSEIDFNDGTIPATPFERMNALVSAMLGEEDIELFKEIEYTEAKTNLDVAHTKSTDTSQRHIKYSPKNADTEAKVTYSFVGVGGNNEIYCYFPSDYKRDSSLYLNGTKISTYFENETYRIVSLGAFDEGYSMTVDLRLDDTTLYIQEDVGYFYYLDTDVFEAVMPRLAECSLDITSFSDTNIKGTVNITGENNLMFTSIPYDSGWVVKIDGKRVETDKTLNALLAFEISSGEHEVELKYSPTSFTYGLIITVCGLITFAAAIIIVKPESVMNIAASLKKRRKNKKAAVRVHDGAADKFTESAAADEFVEPSEADEFTEAASDGFTKPASDGKPPAQKPGGEDNEDGK